MTLAKLGFPKPQSWSWRCETLRKSGAFLSMQNEATSTCWGHLSRDAGDISRAFSSNDKTGFASTCKAKNAMMNGDVWRLEYANERLLYRVAVRLYHAGDCRFGRWRDDVNAEAALKE